MKLSRDEVHCEVGPVVNRSFKNAHPFTFSKGKTARRKAGAISKLLQPARRSLGWPVAFLALLAISFASAPFGFAQATCPLSQGYWKNHTSAWQLTMVQLGTSYTVSAVQAEALLETPVKGDASVNLAHQLIAALLNIANGSDPSSVSAAIADAQTAIGGGAIPEHVHSSSALGQQMVTDAQVLNAYNSGALTPTCGTAPPPPPPGSCEPSSSLSVMVNNTAKTVVSYVPKGSWGHYNTGVSVVNVEGSSITPTLISTPSAVNSCASNPVTGVTVCAANDNNVYLLTGTTLSSTLTSGGSGTIGFTGGICTNCSVAMDATHNMALIGLSLAGTPGFQFLDLATSTFETPFASASGFISEDPLIDPTRSSTGGPGALLLSGSENNNYEIADVTTTTSPSFFENQPAATGFMDSSGEDCSTGIALAPYEFTSNVFIGDLTQATFATGTPGTWSAPSQIQTLSESYLDAGASGIAVAQGTHTGVVTGEFGGSNITAIALPVSSGTGTPAIGDWVTCAISGFNTGDDPHTVTAYASPNSGDAITVLANEGATSLAVVDLTQMLNPTIVPRDVVGHACSAGTLPASVVTFVSVP